MGKGIGRREMTNRGARNCDRVADFSETRLREKQKGGKKKRRKKEKERKKKNPHPFDGMVERLPMHTRPRMLAHVHAKMRLIINFAFTFYTKGPARIARFCKLVRRADPRGVNQGEMGVLLPC